MTEREDGVSMMSWQLGKTYMVSLLPLFSRRSGIITTSRDMDMHESTAYPWRLGRLTSVRLLPPLLLKPLAEALQGAQRSHLLRIHTSYLCRVGLLRPTTCNGETLVLPSWR
jgi:hypothetical protein